MIQNQQYKFCTYFCYIYGDIEQKKTQGTVTLFQHSTHKRIFYTIYIQCVRAAYAGQFSFMNNRRRRLLLAQASRKCRFFAAGGIPFGGGGVPERPVVSRPNREPHGTSEKVVSGHISTSPPRPRLETKRTAATVTLTRSSSAPLLGQTSAFSS